MASSFQAEDVKQYVAFFKKQALDPDYVPSSSDGSSSDKSSPSSSDRSSRSSMPDSLIGSKCDEGESESDTSYDDPDVLVLFIYLFSSMCFNKLYSVLHEHVFL